MSNEVAWFIGWLMGTLSLGIGFLITTIIRMKQRNKDINNFDIPEQIYIKAYTEDENGNPKEVFIQCDKFYMEEKDE